MKKKLAFGKIKNSRIFLNFKIFGQTFCLCSIDYAQFSSLINAGTGVFESKTKFVGLKPSFLIILQILDF